MQSQELHNAFRYFLSDNMEWWIEKKNTVFLLFRIHPFILPMQIDAGIASGIRW